MNNMLRLVCLKNRYEKIFPLVFSRSFCANKFKPFQNKLLEFPNNIAVIDDFGSFKYKDILYSSFLIAKKIKSVIPDCTGSCERISFLCSSDATYVSVLLACWFTGNVAVPLNASYPSPMLEYFIKDSQSKLVIANERFRDPIQNIAHKLNASFFVADRDILASPSISNYNELRASEFCSWNSDIANRNALIIYTSGTTGQPKGVVLTHGILHAQVSAVVQSWEISSKDSILHALPLHHIHGIMNALLCPLNVGGCIVMRPKFIASEVWEYLLNSDKKKPDVNLFFAVPTMYTMLIREFEEMSKTNKSTKNRPLENMRLMSSGSAALPEPVFYQWENITGHRLLERFGMSEIGMALSNPLNGERIPGCVGTPLPRVEVKIQRINDLSQETVDIVYGDDSKINILPEHEGESGELLIRGPNVFKEYWNKEKATQESFTNEGWFKTGDTASYESGSFKILGRTSVDIIKSGGYKISGLQVESCLLLHPDIVECSVFGLPDDVWGERVVAIILLKKGKKMLDTDVKSWCQSKLPKYAVPSIIKFVDTIPRNVMGKVNKKALKLKF